MTEKYNITFADNARVLAYDEIANDFLLRIFKLNASECMISDESCLSDFAGCCLPADFDEEETISLHELYDISTKYMLAEIKNVYGLDVKSNAYLFEVFAQIQQSLEK